MDAEKQEALSKVPESAHSLLEGSPGGFDAERLK